MVSGLVEDNCGRAVATAPGMSAMDVCLVVCSVEEDVSCSNGPVDDIVMMDNCLLLAWASVG